MSLYMTRVSVLTQTSSSKLEVGRQLSYRCTDSHRCLVFTSRPCRVPPVGSIITLQFAYLPVCLSVQGLGKAWEQVNDEAAGLFAPSL